MVKRPRYPQRSNAARVRNMTRFAAAKLPESSKTVQHGKNSKGKAVTGKRSLKRRVSVKKNSYLSTINFTV